MTRNCLVRYCALACASLLLAAGSASAQVNPNLYAGLNYATYTYGSIHNAPGLVSLRNGGGYKGYSLN